ncbi:hypothetical protein ACS0TY_019764 [Phlomoides rotata]
MWKLKIAEGSSPWLRSVNGHVGRQTWEFDPSLGSPEELAEIEKLREQFHVTRFEKKHSSDLLMRLQLSKENPATTDIPQVKVKDVEDITEEKVTNTLRRAISSHSTLQAKDGHWPGDYGGPMFLLPGLVITLSITGTLNAILTEEHQREIRRYLYNHQNRDGGWGLHIEGPSTMIGSVLTYVTLRLRGEGANDGDGSMEKGRDWILEHGGGGATAITSWGKDVALGLELTPYIAVYVICSMCTAPSVWKLLIVFSCFLFRLIRCLGPLNGLETILCHLRYGFFHIFYQSIQEGCGVIVEWFIFPCPICMGKDLLAHSHPQFFL